MPGPVKAATPVVPGARPLSARSVVASTLLGTEPPRLPGRLLVRAAELFGIAEGTTRVALSRMVAAGELEADDGHYRLVGPLLQRQARQSASRRADHRPWGGQWVLAVVAAERRGAPARAALRDAMRQLQLAELREGVWLRPDNLDPARQPAARAVVRGQCRLFTGRPEPAGDDRPEPAGSHRDARSLAASLWDLDAWSTEAVDLRGRLEALVPALEAGDPAVLAPAFVLSAAVLRHLLADPLLPEELLPAEWPGAALRGGYDHYDAAFRVAWQRWFDAQT